MQPYVRGHKRRYLRLSKKKKDLGVKHMMNNKCGVLARLAGIAGAVAVSFGLVSCEGDSHDGDKPTDEEYANLIGDEKAESIAFKAAGVSESSLIWWETEFDRENGILVYDIDFRTASAEYECDVVATTGEVYKLKKTWEESL